jgi:2-polyprenyl-6-hydroxyphenyl methylase/3-demethylubiquinone-9 3-methyltransferase
MNTVNKNEVNKFSIIASEWWNPEGKFKPLHQFNPVRLAYIKDKIKNHFDNSYETIDLLDIGCGGGLCK